MCDYKLCLGGNSPISILRFTDSDWANCLDTRWSIGGHAYTLGSSIISWQACKQKTVTASSCEAEYITAFKASKEAIWLQTLLGNIGYQPEKPTMIFCNNNAAINLSEDPLLHNNIKYIDIKHHFLCEHVQTKEITLSYINTHNNIANIFTRALDTKKIMCFWNFLGIKASQTMWRGVFMVRSVVIITIPWTCFNHNFFISLSFSLHPLCMIHLFILYSIYIPTVPTMHLSLLYCDWGEPLYIPATTSSLTWPRLIITVSSRILISTGVIKNQ